MSIPTYRTMVRMDSAFKKLKHKFFQFLKLHCVKKIEILINVKAESYKSIPLSNIEMVFENKLKRQMPSVYTIQCTHFL